MRVPKRLIYSKILEPRMWSAAHLKNWYDANDIICTFNLISNSISEISSAVHCFHFRISVLIYLPFILCGASPGLKLKLKLMPMLLAKTATLAENLAISDFLCIHSISCCGNGIWCGVFRTYIWFQTHSAHSHAFRRGCRGLCVWLPIGNTYIGRKCEGIPLRGVPTAQPGCGNRVHCIYHEDTWGSNSHMYPCELPSHQSSTSYLV